MKMSNKKEEATKVIQGNYIYILECIDKKQYKDKIVTEVVPFKNYFKAENGH